MFKKAICIVIFSFVALFLFSCAKVSGSITDELDDGPTSEQIVNTLVTAAPSPDGYQTVDEDYISRMNFGEKYTNLLDAVADWCIVTSKRHEVNADMIGVFRLKSSADIPLAASVINEYLAAQRQRMATAYSGYAPDQIPKIDNAEVTRCGNYFLVTFLEESREDAVEDMFEDMLEG